MKILINLNIEAVNFIVIILLYISIIILIKNKILTVIILKKH